MNLEEQREQFREALQAAYEEAEQKQAFWAERKEQLSLELGYFAPVPVARQTERTDRGKVARAFEDIIKPGGFAWIFPGVSSPQARKVYDLSPFEWQSVRKRLKGNHGEGPCVRVDDDHNRSGGAPGTYLMKEVAHDRLPAAY